MKRIWKKKKYIYIYNLEKISESLCYIPETNTL